MSLKNLKRLKMKTHLPKKWTTATTMKATITLVQVVKTERLKETALWASPRFQLEIQFFTGKDNFLMQATIYIQVAWALRGSDAGIQRKKPSVVWKSHFDFSFMEIWNGYSLYDETLSLKILVFVFVFVLFLGTREKIFCCQMRSNWKASKWEFVLNWKNQITSIFLFFSSNMNLRIIVAPLCWNRFWWNVEALRRKTCLLQNGIMQQWAIRLEDLKDLSPCLLDLLASLEPGPMTELLAFIDLAHFLPPVLCFLYSHGPSSMVYSIFTFRANMWLSTDGSTTLTSSTCWSLKIQKNQRRRWSFASGLSPPIRPVLQLNTIQPLGKLTF